MQEEARILLRNNKENRGKMQKVVKSFVNEIIIGGNYFSNYSLVCIFAG